MTNNSFRLNINQFLVLEYDNSRYAKPISVVDSFYYVLDTHKYKYQLCTYTGAEYSPVTPNIALRAIINSKTLSKKQFLNKVKEICLDLQI